MLCLTEDQGEEEQQQEESLFKADAVNEEDPEENGRKQMFASMEYSYVGTCMCARPANV